MLTLFLSLWLTLIRACIFESSISLNSTMLTLHTATTGCNTARACTSYPLVSFSGAEIDDQLPLIACSRSILVACNTPQYIISPTFFHALFLPMPRTASQVGLNNTDGYWTFANKHGEILPHAFTDPFQDLFLLGSERTATDLTLRKKWMCMCTD